MDNGESIAVVIPLHNREGLIADTLQSLLRQTRPPDALIVVDDASLDRSVSVVERWIDREKPSFPVRILKHTTNKGAAAARNLGLASIHDHEFVYFLDSDDAPSARFIEESLRAFGDAGDGMVAVSADRIMKKPTGERKAHVGGLAANPFLFFYGSGAGILSCTVLRVKDAKALGGFNESIMTGHDTDFFIRLAKRGSWGRATGCSVSFLCGENEFHLRGRYKDYPRRWASGFEFFLDNYDIRERIDYRFACRELGRRWLTAGHHFIGLKMFDDAAHCFRRSLAWRPLKNMSWIYLLSLPLLRLGIVRGYLSKRIKTGKDA